MHPLFILAKMIVRSHVTRWRARRGAIEADFGSTHQNVDLARSLEYIHRCHGDYVRYGELAGRPDLEILEGGPGDNLGIGALMLAGGARRYVGVDAFYSRQDGEQQRRIYQELRRGLPPGAPQAAFDAAIDLRDGVRLQEDRLRMVYGAGLGDVDRLFPAASFDVVMSRAVLEQVHGIEAAFGAMDRVLRPGGLLLHKIDFSDYGIFSGKGHHPLTLLTLPDSWYGLLAPNTGNLNRWSAADYRALLRRMGYRARFYVTGTVQPGYPARPCEPHPETLRAGTDYGEKEVALIGQIRPRLQPRYRQLPDEDLITAGIFLAAWKPE